MIESEEECDAVMARIEVLLDDDYNGRLTPDGEKELQTLEELLTEYEEKHYPMPPPIKNGDMLDVLQGITGESDKDLGDVVGKTPLEIAVLKAGTKTWPKALCDKFEAHFHLGSGTFVADHV